MLIFYGGLKLDSYFAPALKASNEKLSSEIKIINTNSVVSGVLHSIGGLLAILNENRQILAINDLFLRELGVDDPGATIGLRPGEALQCIHAKGKPAGCGTTKYCSTCGAAIAIVSSLEQNVQSEKICIMKAKRGDREVDIALLVKAQPIHIEQERFLLLFLQDITKQQQLAALERTFFHDVNNMLAMLVGASELLVEESPSELSNVTHQVSLRLMEEIAIQRVLSQSEDYNYHPTFVTITPQQIMEDLKSFFVHHPIAQNKTTTFVDNYPEVSITTDNSLVQRVLCNMIINALEATIEYGEVKIWLEIDGDFLIFNVWNAQEIPGEVALRLFQRNFSTKEQTGRGVGTYSMKLFGEENLGGQVDFTTSREEGTTFIFKHPL